MIEAAATRLRPRWRGRLLQQGEVRAIERDARRAAVAYARWLACRGRHMVEAAVQLDLDVETLQRWCSAWRRNRLPARPRGRRARTMDRDQRQGVIAARRERPARGLPALRAESPQIGRNALAELLARQRFLREKRRRRQCAELDWRVPGAVWAIDGTWLPWPVEDLGRRVLVVPELATRVVLDAWSVSAERAEETIAGLERLFERHGRPLVLKADNGPGFSAQALRKYCESQGVVLLHSPPRCPRYNGACESHVRWAAERIERAARSAGRTGWLANSDLRAASTARGVRWSIGDDLRAHFQATLDRERHAVAGAAGLAELESLGHAGRAPLERVAIQRALCACHVLTIWRR